MRDAPRCPVWYSTHVVACCPLMTQDQRLAPEARDADFPRRVRNAARVVPPPVDALGRTRTNLPQRSRSAPPRRRRDETTHVRRSVARASVRRNAHPRTRASPPARPSAPQQCTVRRARAATNLEVRRRGPRTATPGRAACGAHGMRVDSASRDRHLGDDLPTRSRPRHRTAAAAARAAARGHRSPIESVPCRRRVTRLTLESTVTRAEPLRRGLPRTTAAQQRTSVTGDDGNNRAHLPRDSGRWAGRARPAPALAPPRRAAGRRPTAHPRRLLVGSAPRTAPRPCARSASSCARDGTVPRRRVR